MILAIDGTTASGKGTLARRLAAHFGLSHLDTGLLYRAVAAKALREGAALGDAEWCGRLAQALDLTDFDEGELRGSGIGAAASVVAAHGPVRAALFDMQRAFALRPAGAVLDGRDIGTVIAPEAEVKFWIDATVEIRARRRFRELVALGEPISEAEVLAQLRERDVRDAGRKDAPMMAAAGAHRLDTTAMDPDEVTAWGVGVVQRHLIRGSPNA
ncbi:MAG: (d)CMP kinase [Alphaproteobacteria bacterium]|mgnify:CR=1 FL=1|nr:(d)CMP kinase [Alphaproteobacteria bacterium]